MQDKNPILSATEVVDKTLHEELDNLLNLLKASDRAEKVRTTARKVVQALSSMNLIPPDARNKLNGGGYPKQSRVGSIVEVSFPGDAPGKSYEGTVIRGDTEGPGETVIILDDGRVVISRECWWQYTGREADWVKDEQAKRKAVLEANRLRAKAEEEVAAQNLEAAASALMQKTDEQQGLTGGEAP